MSAKAHHYVPQFYLRHFAKRQRKKYYLWCFDKQTGNTYRSNPKNLAQETGYYDLITPDGNEATIEDYLSRLETRFGIALDNINKNPSSKVLRENINEMSLFVACQMIRTPLLHKEIIDASNGVNKKLEKDHVQIPLPTIDELKQIQASLIEEDIPIMAKVLSEMLWIILHNDTNIPLYTSDYPISKYNPISDGIRGNLGLLSEGIQILFPINPFHALIICDRRRYIIENNEIEAVPQHIEFINSGQVIYSQRYIYSRSNSFEFVKSMITQNPELANPDRKRIDTR